MNKKETRAQKKARKALKRKEKSVKLSSSFVDQITSDEPRIQSLPDDEKRPKTQAKFGRHPVPKQVKSIENGSRFGYQMTWCARHADCNGSWGWGENRKWSDEEWSQSISQGLNSIEKLDWKEIQCMNSGTGHAMHHDQDVSSLCDEAVERWIELGFEQFDTTFRFRLGSTKRVWGIELQGHFYLIWYERYHKIYPI